MGVLSIKLILYILLIHYLGDFSLQTDEQARGKSTSDKLLGYHVLTYSTTWFFAILIWYEHIGAASLFFFITFISHFITDYFTSRWSSKYFKKQDFHHAFLVIGFDQILHYIQLIFTFQFISYLLTL